MTTEHCGNCAYWNVLNLTCGSHIPTTGRGLCTNSDSGHHQALTPWNFPACSQFARCRKECETVLYAKEKEIALLRLTCERVSHELHPSQCIYPKKIQEVYETLRDIAYDGWMPLEDLRMGAVFMTKSNAIRAIKVQSHSTYYNCYTLVSGDKVYIYKDELVKELKIKEDDETSR